MLCNDYKKWGFKKCDIKLNIVLLKSVKIFRFYDKFHHDRKIIPLNNK